MLAPEGEDSHRAAERRQALLRGTKLVMYGTGEVVTFLEYPDLGGKAMRVLSAAGGIKSVQESEVDGILGDGRKGT